MFVFLFGGGFVVFVFHLEHDGDDFVAFFVGFAVDVVAFAAGFGVVVLAENGLWKGGGADAVEFGFAVLLEAFSYHFGGLSGFEVFVEGDGFIFLFEFGFVFFAQALFFQLVFFGLQHELRVQIAQFALFFGNGFGDFQLFSMFFAVSSDFACAFSSAINLSCSAICAFRRPSISAAASLLSFS